MCIRPKYRNVFVIFLIFSFLFTLIYFFFSAAVTEVVWEGEETETKKTDSDTTKKADSNTTKKPENNTVVNNESNRLELLHNLFK